MLKDKYILAIDDSLAIRNYLNLILVRQGAQVELAANGKEGLDACEQPGRHYDLILLDLILPDTNGIDVLKQIRAHDKETAVVILTGLGGIKSATAAIQEGADAYIEKQDIAAGNDLTEFFYILDQALERRAGIVAQEQLGKIKADFYSMVTHDLRNPAGCIYTAAQVMMTANNIDSLSPQTLTLIEIIHEASRKIMNLINDYLDFAKIDAGYLRLECASVDLRHVVEASMRLSQMQAEAKRQTLTLDLPAQPINAYADGERLTQVVDNLLSNAVKYTPEAGQITVSLCETDGQAVFRISDTGIGIPPEQVPALFTKYHRVPGEATLGIRGTGLGLLIVKEIINAHGGTITAESEGIKGKGSTFTITIPLMPAEG
ncbi:MAG: hybrid sensor histidine kinase/response regulator [Anaerolineae bacterium]|nr:hybrid sensor histidine kinase/response regulator [Anaerolineae bacterium]